MTLSKRLSRFIGKEDATKKEVCSFILAYVMKHELFNSDRTLFFPDEAMRHAMTLPKAFVGWETIGGAIDGEMSCRLRWWVTVALVASVVALKRKATRI